MEYNIYMATIKDKSNNSVEAAHHKSTKSALTKKLIEDTFLTLLSTRPLTSISIKDITTTANLNRNTFYYYYKNIPDLIESIVKNFVDDIIEKYPPTYDSFEDCLLVAVNFAKENRESIYHIYNSASRSIFERYLWKICDYTVNTYIDSFPNTAPIISNDEVDILKEMLKFECFGFTMDWIMRGMPEGVTEKVKLLSASIKNQIKHLPSY